MISAKRWFGPSGRLTCGVDLEVFWRVLGPLHALVPQELLEFNKVRLPNFVLEDLEPENSESAHALPGENNQNRTYQLSPMVAHSSSRSRRSSSDNEPVNFVREKGMAFND